MRRNKDGRRPDLARRHIIVRWQQPRSLNNFPTRSTPDWLGNHPGLVAVMQSHETFEAPPYSSGETVLPEDEQSQWEMHPELMRVREVFRCDTSAPVRSLPHPRLFNHRPAQISGAMGAQHPTNTCNQAAR